MANVLADGSRLFCHCSEWDVCGYSAVEWNAAPNVEVFVCSVGF